MLVKPGELVSQYIFNQYVERFNQFNLRLVYSLLLLKKQLIPPFILFSKNLCADLSAVF